MSSTTLYRLSGLALLIALPISIVGWVLHPAGESLRDLLSPFQTPAHVIQLVAFVFVLLGVPGLYARQAHRAGVLGLIGFILTMLLTAFHIYLLLYEAVVAPILAGVPATQPLIVTGGVLAHGTQVLDRLSPALLLAWPLFGLATVRAGVLPRWSGWLQLATFPMMIVGFVLFFLAGDVLARLNLPLSVTPLAWTYYLLFLGYAGGGYVLWSEKERTQATTYRDVPQPV
jgi:uncharacterized Tic20 family protein